MLEDFFYTKTGHIFLKCFMETYQPAHEVLIFTT